MSIVPASAHPGGQHRPRRLLVAALAFLLGGLTVVMLYQFDVLGGTSDTAGSATDGSGVAATQAREVSAFRSVDLAGSNNVVVRVGERQSVVVKADDNLLDRVTTEVQSGTLVIANTPGSFTTKSPMRVEIDVPALDALTLSGSGNIVVTGVEAKRLAVNPPAAARSRGTERRRASTSGSAVLERWSSPDSLRPTSGQTSAALEASS